jgi:hypothetical protein
VYQYVSVLHPLFVHKRDRFQYVTVIRQPVAGGIGSVIEGMQPYVNIWVQVQVRLLAHQW